MARYVRPHPQACKGREIMAYAGSREKSGEVGRAIEVNKIEMSSLMRRMRMLARGVSRLQLVATQVLKIKELIFWKLQIW